MLWRQLRDARLYSAKTINLCDSKFRPLLKKLTYIIIYVKLIIKQNQLNFMRDAKVSAKFYLKFEPRLIYITYRGKLIKYLKYFIKFRQSQVLIIRKKKY